MDEKTCQEIWDLPYILGMSKNNWEIKPRFIYIYFFSEVNCKLKEFQIKK